MEASTQQEASENEVRAQAREKAEEKKQKAAAAQAQAQAKDRVARLVKVASSGGGYMDQDNVRPAQFAVYERLLTEEDSPIAAILDAQDREQLEAHCKRNPPFPADLSKQLRIEMEQAGLVTSHVWVKGLTATYLALQDERNELAQQAEGAKRD